MRKIFCMVLLLLISAISMAEEIVYKLADFPKEKKSYFDVVGKSYTAKSDNPFLLERFSSPISLIYYKRFLKEPNEDLCKKDSCGRKHITSNIKFIVEGIVSPSDKARRLSCNENIIFCYYKFRFDDGDVTYMKVANFIFATSPTNTAALNHMGFLQAYPLVPDESWKREKRYFDVHFKELGPKQGYTQEDVLNSQWGKPISKTHSSLEDIEVDVWVYDNEMLTFVNGYVTEVTTSR